MDHVFKRSRRFVDTCSRPAPSFFWYVRFGRFGGVFTHFRRSKLMLKCLGPTWGISAVGSVSYNIQIMTPVGSGGLNHLHQDKFWLWLALRYPFERCDKHPQWEAKLSLSRWSLCPRYSQLTALNQHELPCQQKQNRFFVDSPGDFKECIYMYIHSGSS